jgi:hypothetical protein
MADEEERVENGGGRERERESKEEIWGQGEWEDDQARAR